MNRRFRKGRLRFERSRIGPRSARTTNDQEEEYRIGVLWDSETAETAVANLGWAENAEIPYGADIQVAAVNKIHGDQNRERSRRSSIINNSGIATIR